MSEASHDSAANGGRGRQFGSALQCLELPSRTPRTRRAVEAAMPPSLSKRPILGFGGLRLVLGVAFIWTIGSSARAATAQEYDYPYTMATWAEPGAPLPEPALEEPLPGQLDCAAYGKGNDSQRRASAGCRLAWGAGVEWTMVKPRFEDGAEEEWQQDVVDFGLASAPRAWLSFGDPAAAALRAQYWQFDHTSEPRRVVHAPADYRICALVEAHTVDLELTHEFHFERWSLRLGGGARYAMLQQTVQMTDGPDRWFKRLQAIGPTMALESRWVTRLPHFWVFANCRGSLLSGEARRASPSEAQDTDDIGTILEMQVGGELRWSSPRGGALFVRGGWEQQNWLGAGSFFSAAGPSAGEILGVMPDDHDVGFMGFFVSLGADW